MELLARTSTGKSLPFLWHRRQHGLPEGADFVGSDRGATGFLWLLRCKSGAGECGLLSGTPFVVVTWGVIGFFWLLSGECGACECRLLSGLPSYSAASGAVAGILA